MKIGIVLFMGCATMVFPRRKNSMCGIIGFVEGGNGVAAKLYRGLMGLQHRGKSGAGMYVASGEGKARCFKGEGELPQAFHGLATDKIVGNVGIGQVRYGTTGSNGKHNIQPIKRKFRGHYFYLVHNGNVINLKELSCGLGWLKRLLSTKGASDTQIVADLLSSSRAASFEQALLEVLPRLQGAFNFIALYRGKLYAVKDRFGFHPLQYCTLNDGFAVASESCALPPSLGHAIDVMPGELLVFERGKVQKLRWENQVDLKIDIFEYIYFLRPDSVVHGVPVGLARRAMGRLLWEAAPTDVDVICPVSDSGNEAALGYAQAAAKNGSPWVYDPYALFRPHAFGRTFIEPIEAMRHEGLNLKFVARPECLCGKRVLLVDDSVVRAITAGKISTLVRNAGAISVHLALSSPPYVSPDFYGIDTYRKKYELAAKRFQGDTKAMATRYGFDSINYLSLEATKQAVLDSRLPGSPLTENSFYCGPFDGVYPDGTGDYSV